MLLGRATSARREAVDATPGYRNGHGKPRRLTLTSGTITVRRPGSETSAAKRFKKAENAIALIWKLLMNFDDQNR